MIRILFTYKLYLTIFKNLIFTQWLAINTQNTLITKDKLPLTMGF
jgi:hypothetical protein